VLERCISDAACSRTFGTPTSGVWIIHPRTGVAAPFPPKFTFSRGWAEIAIKAMLPQGSAPGKLFAGADCLLETASTLAVDASKW